MVLANYSKGPLFRNYTILMVRVRVRVRFRVSRVRFRLVGLGL